MERYWKRDGDGGSRDAGATEQDGWITSNNVEDTNIDGVSDNI